MKKRYDFIMSLGQCCLTPNILREKNLRLFSGPFDWSQVEDYRSIINIVKNRFERYFLKENIKFLFLDKERNVSVYKDVENNIIYPHIDNYLGFENMYSIAKRTYKRRIARFFNFIKDNKKILLLYIQSKDSKENITNEDILKDIEDLNKIYNKKCFDILYLKHEGSLKMNECRHEKHIYYVNNTPIDKEKPFRGNQIYVTNLISRKISLKKGFFGHREFYRFIRKFKLFLIAYSL